MPKKIELNSNLAVVVLREEVLREIMSRQLKQDEQLNVSVQISVHVDVVPRQVELKPIEKIPTHVLKTKVLDFFSRQRLVDAGIRPDATRKMLNLLDSAFGGDGEDITIKEFVEQMHEDQRSQIERFGSAARPWSSIQGVGSKTVLAYIRAINAAT